MMSRLKKGNKDVRLQKQVGDLCLSLALTIQAADILAANQLTLTNKLTDLEQALASTQEELRILRTEHGA